MVIDAAPRWLAPLSLVMAGLDLAICPQRIGTRSATWTALTGVDGRVKPGDDGRDERRGRAGGGGRGGRLGQDPRAGAGRGRKVAAAMSDTGSDTAAMPETHA